jgi:hypothetical protein
VVGSSTIRPKGLAGSRENIQKNQKIGRPPGAAFTLTVVEESHFGNLVSPVVGWVMKGSIYYVEKVNIRIIHYRYPQLSLG